MITPRDFFTTEELTAKRSGQFICDTESFENYFLAAFMDIETRKIAYFESIGNDLLQGDWLTWMLDRFTNVGFNFKKYDLPMLGMAASGHTPQAIKAASNDLILHGDRISDIEARYTFKTPICNNVDLIEVAPLTGSLKLYAGRLGCTHLQDLPFHPDTVLTREQIATVRNYCFNDLENTLLLLRKLEPSLHLRAALSVEFKRDFRSLSDAQMAEVIISQEITRITGKRPKRPDFTKQIGRIFRYDAPSYIGFASPHLQAILAEIVTADIIVGNTGHVICPKAIEGRQIEIAGKAYTIGIGGLHSKEKEQTVKAGEYRILDRDVTGYYPNLMLKNSFYPEAMGSVFLEALQSIVDKRYAAKKSNDKTTADGLKIASNGTFGKTSDPYSIVYDPKMMIQTTISGQLSLLMAVEWLASCGFDVISANTDGIVTLVRPERYNEFEYIFDKWEQITSLETEQTEYNALYSRDVNNYIAVKPDGEIKAKGVYAYVGSALNSELSKNPVFNVVIDAVRAHLTAGTPLIDTIEACQDMTRFCCIRAVTGGAQKNGRYLGKVVRWYYAAGERGTIDRATNGNKVALSDGGKPLMILPPVKPNDIDYGRYVDMAIGILEDIGFQKRLGEQIRLL
jgi:hypothetical protein